MARARARADVGEHASPGRGSLRAARRRDDAVRAEERAAVLDLDERPGPLDRRPAVGDALDLDARTASAAPARRARHRAGRAASRRRPDQPLELLEQRVLRAVVDEPRRRVGRRERLPADLDRAAGDDDRRRPGSPAARDARPGATSASAVGGDRAGVDEDEVRAGAASPSTTANTALAKQPGGRLHLGLVDLAAEVRDRGGADGRAPRGPVRRRSPQLRLRAHQEADRPDERGHRVAHVALALRPLQPDPVVGGGPDADQPAQVGPLDEEREGQVGRVDRERDEQPRLGEQRCARASARAGRRSRRARAR